MTLEIWENVRLKSTGTMKKAKNTYEPRYPSSREGVSVELVMEGNLSSSMSDVLFLSYRLTCRSFCCDHFVMIWDLLVVLASREIIHRQIKLCSL